jgi:hypothetical protein
MQHWYQIDKLTCSLGVSCMHTYQCTLRPPALGVREHTELHPISVIVASMQGFSRPSRLPGYYSGCGMYSGRGEAGPLGHVLTPYGYMVTRYSIHGQHTLWSPALDVGDIPRGGQDAHPPVPLTCVPAVQVIGAHLRYIQRGGGQTKVHIMFTVTLV